MQKNYKASSKGVNFKAGQRHSELNFSRTPVVISSSSFKRYDLEDKVIPNNSISLATIASLGRFLPFGLKFKPLRRS